MEFGVTRELRLPQLALASFKRPDARQQGPKFPPKTTKSPYAFSSFLCYYLIFSFHFTVLQKFANVLGLI
jgi:hypothetical protein